MQTASATIKECVQCYKSAGFRGVIRKYGWKVFVIFFVYYLVRDLTFYVLVPYLFAKGFIG